MILYTIGQHFRERVGEFNIFSPRRTCKVGFERDLGKDVWKCCSGVLGFVVGRRKVKKKMLGWWFPLWLDLERCNAIDVEHLCNCSLV